MKLLKEFVAFVNERWAIHERRAAGQPAPWTKDPILQKYRFCNVRREDDRVTKWIHREWLEKVTHDENAWFAMAVARLVNWPESLLEAAPAVIAYRPQRVVWVPRMFTKALNARKRLGEQVYSGAYMIRAIEAKNGETKADYLAKYVLTPLWDARKEAPVTGTLREFHSWLTSKYGWGSFLAAQVIADSKWSKLSMQKKDWQTFAASGPGSLRGMSWVEFGDVNTKYTELEWQDSLAKLRKLALPKLSKPLRSLDAQNLQNAECEFDKYMRVKSGQGRPKQNFNPSKEPY